jgi:arabinosaccharide transport system substrate-binding protein
MAAPRPRLFDYLSPGAWIILIAAVASSIAYLAWPVPRREGRDLWIFSPPNHKHYQGAVAEWNARQQDPADRLNLVLIHYQALERRLVAAFTAGAPVADLVETEMMLMGRAFEGPLGDVGFVDLTDRLRQEGLFEKINSPSFGAWTTRGRTFALPHDVHPCLLAYRADIVEAAGINVDEIETWEDFRRVLAPLIQDFDGDGRPDRYLLNFWENQADPIRRLLLQAGGDMFDAKGDLAIDTPLNAHVLASLVSWVAGPRRFCIDAPEFTAGGDQMRLQGTVVASILADWQAGTWKNNIPGLAGKVKLMRMPAWTPGGRRTSVNGGTALGITKSSPDFERSWAMAKHLYLSERVAESLYRTTYIISPVKAHWELPFYREPDPYFSGQPVGAMYIQEAPNVPVRHTSPYLALARDRVMSALTMLKAHAVARNQFEADQLLPEAQRLLRQAQAELSARIERNVLYGLDS